MNMLDRKLVRDFVRLWAQSLAIAMVLACGVATLILSVGAYRSLEETRATFYDRYRFATVFASAVRAPRHLKSRIADIPDVLSSELRIAEPVLIDVEGMREPASGMAISLPEFRDPAVNRLYLRRGRLPEPERSSEVAVVETFADAHGFEPGDSFEAIFNGRKQRLNIVGVVLSPEYIYAIGPGDMVPDPRRFGIFFMPEKVMSGLFDMEGAFNDVVLTAARDADTRVIIDRLDEILKPYGGGGAYDREDQISHAFLDAELDQLNAMATVIPPIFLAVAAFLVNMILSRLIALDREQIGLLKALGYRNLTVGMHYAKLVILISLAGILIGSVSGWWLGRGLTRIYAQFYSFPFLIFRQSVDLYFLAGGVSIAAAVAGAAKSIWSSVTLPPAVAMRPPAPTTYRNTFVGALQRIGVFSQLSIMAFRHLLRWPVRSFLTMLGTSMSVALLITSLFSYDSIDYMIDAIFFRADRQDATITFSVDRGPQALIAAAAMPGVMRAEPYRMTPVNLRHGHRELRMSLTGVTPDSDLSRVLDLDLFPVAAPENGVILSERVASKLKLEPGMTVEVELLERDKRLEDVTVVGVAQSYIGLNAYMHLDALDRLLRDGRQISGARISVDEAMLDELYDVIKSTPVISSIALQGVSRDRFRATIEENITTMSTIYVTLAVIITFGVIYNSARIQLSERARELASLRVFGFTKAEVSSVLIIELALIVLAAQPVGWLVGYGLSWSVMQGLQSDLFRVPLIIYTSTYATASLVVIAAAVASVLIVRRRVDHLDLIRVLKTRE
ncbi:ABC transporter permease [Hoeflea sp. WL0058]|uniref:ABC transporter permease n=1 Tax=Flavimaribacter sediminis TaxID=2865987 RepID=A0AAE2ZL39_9HYPH|nr:FtsX-like permease family protein [Flavimaribacter sediminis]MBW8636268.1 ABC transporter permease [Flavimaribacter sediminis]